MEIKIDGVSIKLTEAQKQQLRDSLKKEQEGPKDVMVGNMRISVKQPLGTSSYPLLITSMAIMSNGKYGHDFAPTDVRAFIVKLKRFAKELWPTTENFDSC